MDVSDGILLSIRSVCQANNLLLAGVSDSIRAIPSPNRNSTNQLEQYVTSGRVISDTLRIMRPRNSNFIIHSCGKEKRLMNLARHYIKILVSLQSREKDNGSGTLSMHYENLSN